jgi:hypothetical protein
LPLAASSIRIADPCIVPLIELAQRSLSGAWVADGRNGESYGDLEDAADNGGVSDPEPTR